MPGNQFQNKSATILINQMSKNNLFQANDGQNYENVYDK
jgi:hypothetical protein